MPEKWDQVKELFALALERDPEERSGFLRRACGNDDSLRTEIESLLSSFDGAATFLEDCPAAGLLSAQSRAMAGKRVGAYRIIRECGHGGMAVVYLAERADDQYRKCVAIKMLQPGTNKDEILRRFRNERQALAALDHPNIVRLLDGGSTEEGLPYLVMDYVEGVHIDEYCDLHKLSIPERLQLFRAVCLAVQYAHETLVIHRDLKPSNILITKEGVARLLDFGIAKVLNPQWSPEKTLTRTDWRPMTPEYASPEQVRGDPVTKATDIYSLGVLLYVLLTGRHPYRVRPDSPLQIERSICDQEPQKPSVAVSQIDDKVSHDGNTRTVITPQTVGEARAIRPEELPRCLRGDLDTIVLKAIRKEPEHRYASAEEFAKDIERHLSGMPIKARKLTVFYRGGKFVHRHRESLATAILILAATAGLGSWEARRSWKQRSVNEQASSTVQVRIRPSVAILGFKNLSGRQDTAWISTAMSEMLTAELAAGEQLRTVPDETVARTKIDLGLTNVESLAPVTLTQVRKNLGSDFIILGSYLDPGGEKGQIRLDLRLEDTAKGETVAAVSETGTERSIIDLASQVGSRLREQLGLEKLSQVESVALRAELPSNPEAMRSYSQGLGKIRAFDALSARDLFSGAVAADPSFPLAHSALARAWSSLGYDSDARREAKKALDEAGNLSREKHLLVEARFYETSKDWGKAIEAYQTLFSFFPDNLEYGLQFANAETAGGRGKDALESLATLGAGTRTKGDPRIDITRADAAASLGDDRLRRDAAALAAQKAGEQGAKLLVARALSSECRALANLGENQKATSACEEAMQIYAAAGDRSGLARTLHYMAEVPLNQDDLVTAEQLYSRALSITREIGDKQGTGRELINLGVIFKKRGDLALAQATYAEAYRNDQEVGDKNAMAVVTGNMGNVLQMQGKLPEAMKSYENALALSKEVGHTSSAALALSSIAETLEMEGNLADASRMFQQALTMFDAAGDRGYYAGTLVSFGGLLQQQAELDRARKNYLDALTIQEHLGLKGDVAGTRLALAELNCDSERSAEAESQAREALETFRAEASVTEEISAQAVLSRSLVQQGKTNEASAAIAEALRLSEKSRDVTLRMPLDLAHAYVLAGAKNFAAAENSARQVLGQARHLGFFQLQLKASLALGEVQMQSGSPHRGRQRLEETEKTARSKGFELIARQASTARQATNR
jgi:serine/threonine protein kinase/Tfp pilus assembly protein PilF